MSAPTPIHDHRLVCLKLEQAVETARFANTFIGLQASTIESLQRALEDAIATYPHDGKTVFVSAERQEAWIKALEDSRR